MLPSRQTGRGGFRTVSRQTSRPVQNQKQAGDANQTLNLEHLSRAIACAAVLPLAMLRLYLHLKRCW
jgi:hypothetical protein